jgi:hypothetical protein
MRLYINIDNSLVHPEAVTSDNHSVIWIYPISNTISVTAANRNDNSASLFATIYNFGDMINVKTGKGRNDFESFTIGPHERGKKQ